MADEAEKLFRDAAAAEGSHRHPEDEAHLSSEEEESENEAFERKLLEEEPNFESDMPIFKGSSATLARGNYNTGVKGVIADAFSFESAKRREQRELREKKQPYAPTGPTGHHRGRSIGSQSESADEDELMTQWRKRRLMELKAAGATQRRASPSKRNFGRVEPVDASGYLDAIEKVSKDTIVVVAVYADRSAESNFVLDCLVTIAKRYPTTRFVKMHHLEAEMDVDVMPAVLAYKGGELFQSVMRIVDEIPTGRSLSTESLELVLQRQRIIFKDERL